LLINPYSFPIPLLTLCNGLDGAFTGADTAADANLRLNHMGFLPFTADCSRGTDPNAGCTADTGLLVNLVGRTHPGAHISGTAFVLNVGFILVPEVM
jgi:hypothetical protein